MGVTPTLISGLLVEDLKELWYNDRVQVWDEHKHEYFGLKAISFVTFSDSPVAHNLFEQSKKIGCGYPQCFRETDSQYLSESKKQCTWDISVTFQ
jgi:hypothetical protein